MLTQDEVVSGANHSVADAAVMADAETHQDPFVIFA